MRRLVSEVSIKEGSMARFVLDVDLSGNNSAEIGVTLLESLAV